VEDSMKKRKKVKIDFLVIILSIIAIFFTIYNVKIYINVRGKSNEKVENEETKQEVQAIEMNSSITTELLEEDRNNANFNRLQNLNERERMEYYYGVFLKYVQQKDYDAAYDLLYDDFKANYFPTVETFKTYMEKRYTSNMTAEYNNIERLGDIYVLWVSVSDLSTKKEYYDGKIVHPSIFINVVIQEYDFGDYKLSFSIL